VIVVLVPTDRAVPFFAGGFHIASHSSDKILNGTVAFSLTSKMEVTIINEVEVTKQSDAKELCIPKQTYVNILDINRQEKRTCNKVNAS